MKIAVEVEGVFLKKEICTSAKDGAVQEFTNYYVMYHFGDRDVVNRITEEEYESLRKELENE